MRGENFCASGNAVKTMAAHEAYSKSQGLGGTLLTLGENPWGCPYKIVRKKLRPWAPSVTVLEPHVLREDTLVDTLFPTVQGSVPSRNSNRLGSGVRSGASRRVS